MEKAKPWGELYQERLEKSRRYVLPEKASIDDIKKLKKSASETLQLEKLEHGFIDALVFSDKINQPLFVFEFVNWMYHSKKMNEIRYVNYLNRIRAIFIERCNYLPRDFTIKPSKILKIQSINNALELLKSTGVIADDETFLLENWNILSGKNGFLFLFLSEILEYYQLAELSSQNV
jgi:hypothetical protein